MAEITKTDLTLMANLLDPEVLKPMLAAPYEARLKFLDVMEVDTTLQGQPGTTVTIPAWKYIGPASVVPEGDLYPVSKLAYDKVTYTIKKYAHAVGLTDEDTLSAFGSPLAESMIQLARSIADIINQEVGEAFAAAKLTAEYTDFNGDAIVDALVLFGEDDQDDLKVLYVNPMELGELRKNADFLAYTEKGVDAQRTGFIGNIWGCEVIDSNLVPVGEAYIVKRGYVTFFTKRDTQLEVERITLRGSWAIAANKHGIVAVTHENKCIKLTKATGGGGGE